jgi:hypothetical protein
MARPLRIQYPGAVYHVMVRGNHGQEIFLDDRDRQCFLETLGEACEKTGWRIHAYVLMGNHYQERAWGGGSGAVAGARDAVAWGEGGGIGARAEKHGAEAGAGVVAWEADDSGARVGEPAALDGRGIRSDEGGAKGEWE